MAEVNCETAPARIIVHDFNQAQAALTAAGEINRRIMILSAPMAARSAGPGWWRELVAQVSAAHPGHHADWILDCGDEPGTALAALREGVKRIALDAAEPVWSRVAQIAAQSDAAVMRVDRDGALDLACSNNPQRDCELYLSGPPDGVANADALG